MKQWIQKSTALCVGLVLVLGLALTATAAEPAAGVYVIDLVVADGYDVVLLDAAGNAVTAVLADIDGDGSTDTAYKNAEKAALSFNGVGGNLYVVFMLDGGAAVPTKGNIRYIDQKSGGASMHFTLYPDTMTVPGEYGIYLSDLSSYTQVATFTVVQFVGDALLGDADGSRNVDIMDAVAILKYCANLKPEAFQTDAADVNKDADVDFKDVVLILKYCANLITGF